MIFVVIFRLKIVDSRGQYVTRALAMDLTPLQCNATKQVYNLASCAMVFGWNCLHTRIAICWLGIMCGRANILVRRRLIRGATIALTLIPSSTGQIQSMKEIHEENERKANPRERLLMILICDIV